jgi:hypothetical protein
MEEISTSFCFICLLHLANEQGLQLESVQDQDVMTEAMPGSECQETQVESKVGNIWDLKVGVIYESLSLRLKVKSFHRYIEIRMRHNLHNSYWGT